MGLDNGIMVTRLKREDIPSFVQWWYASKGETETETEFELAYWRKCWGLREAMFNVLHATQDEYKYTIEVDDIPEIISRVYMPFLDKDYWRENADSIWAWDEFIDHLVQEIINLNWLEWYMDEHPEVEVYFYDSY